MSETTSVEYVEGTTIEMDRCRCEAPELRNDTIRYPGAEKLHVETCMDCGGVQFYRWDDPVEDGAPSEDHHWSDQVVMQVTDVVAIFSGAFAGIVLSGGMGSVPADASIGEVFRSLDPLALGGSVAFLLLAILVKTYANLRVLGGGADV